MQLHSYKIYENILNEWLYFHEFQCQDNTCTDVNAADFIPNDTCSIFYKTWCNGPNKLAHLNVQNLQGKRDDFDHLLLLNMFDILGVPKSWLHEYILLSDSEVKSEVYNVVVLRDNTLALSFMSCNVSTKLMFIWIVTTWSSREIMTNKMLRSNDVCHCKLIVPIPYNE